MAGEEEPSAYAIKAEDVVASARIATNGNSVAMYDFEKAAYKFSSERRRLILELLDIFSDTSSANLNQCSAAFYLGGMRAREAADGLATKIALKFNPNGFIIHGLPLLSEYPAMDALIEIGSPSIPPLIRNLKESDDIQVRESSLKSLYRVEGDKDIAQTRLQNALKAEVDPQKQARLQKAMRALTAPSFH